MKRLLICRPILPLLVGTLLLGSPCQTFGQFNPLGKQKGQVTNVFLPAPRALRQQLTKARQALAEQRYSEAVELLGQLLASGEALADRFDDLGEQDYFLNASNEPGTQISLKTDAQRMLGGMPEKGRALYELKFGADARQQLDRALTAHDMQQVVDVTRRYFHTDAGYEAMMLIGRYYLDQGRPLAAALRLQRLEGSTFATRRYDPELSILLATCWMLADMPERARKTLQGLESRAPASKLRVGNRAVALFDPTDETLVESIRATATVGTTTPNRIDVLLIWLKQIIGPEVTSRLNEATQWTMFRGNAARNGESAGGTPLLSARWRVQAANHPSDEEMIRQSRKQYLEQSVPVIPTLSPLAVGNVIIMRSPRRLLGVDFETGKRIWEFPWFEAPDEDEWKIDRIRPRKQARSPRILELNQRIWDDAPYGHTTSDGKSVFVLWGLASDNTSSVNVQQFGVLRPNQASMVTTNKLVALDLKGEGKLRWIVGDEDGTDEPQLAGAFFLGAPLPLMGQLYALAEINGEIRLVVLDADTGAMKWSQQLAHVDARNIRSDPARRAAGATPSFSDGVLVCPTSSGAVIAVDISSRSLLWGYQYPLSGPRTRTGIASFRYMQKPLGERWSDATITIADGRVLATPVESEKLHCLDLVSGESMWKPIDRGDMLFTGCVFKGNAIMVGKHQVQAISLKDGKTKWTCKLSSGLPSGRGMLTSGHYYLPTTTRRLLKIELAQGKIVEDLETDSILGNLVAYQDQIISLNVDWLSAYYQTDPLRGVVAKRLEDDPKDAWALARKAELLLHDGKHGAALKVFQLAYKLNPEDDAIRASLVRSLLSALRDDFSANQRFATELEELINQPEELADFCRSMAVGMKQIGNYEQATEYFVRLAAMETTGEFGSVNNRGTELVRIDDQLQVDRNRWLRVQIQQMLAEIKGAVRQSVDKMIRTHLEEVLQSNSISKLGLFVEHFGSHDAGIEARMQLARLLLERGHLLHAELQLLELENATDPTIAATATALLARMLVDNGKLEEAAMCVQQLTTRWSDVATLDGPTGSQVAVTVMENEALRQWVQEPTRWLNGKCETIRHNRRALTTYSRVFPIALDEIRGPFPRFQSLVYNQNKNALALRDSLGIIKQQVLLGDRNRFLSTRSAAGRATTNGHLLVLNLGFEVMAVDTLRGASQQGDVVLWRNDLSGNLVLATNRTRQLVPKTITRKWGPARIVPSDTAHTVVGLAGPVTRLGVVYQKTHELVCADPLTGKTIWARSGVTPGSDIFGDEDYTFVVGPDSSEALVLSTADGTDLGRRQVTSRVERWITSGRNVVTCRSDGKRLAVRCFDAWEQRELWSRSFDDDTQCWRPGRDEVAMFQPDGKFVILNLLGGNAVVECQLQAKPDLTRLYTLASKDSFTVVAGGKKPNNGSNNIRFYGSIGGDLCPEINGHVYSISRKTGKPRWSGPAKIYGYYLPLDQAPDSPALVFLQNTRSKASARPTRTTYKAAVLFIDKRDGREIYSADGLERMLNYSIEADPPNQTVVVKTNVNEFVMKFTDKPVEAAKPVEMKASVKPTAGDKAMDSVGKIAGAILDAITEKAKQEKKAKEKKKTVQKQGGRNAPKTAPKKSAEPEKKK